MERCLSGRKSMIGNHVYLLKSIEGSNPSLSSKISMVSYFPSPSFFIEILLEGLPISSSGHVLFLSQISPYFNSLSSFETHLSHVIYITVQLYFLVKCAVVLYQISFFTLLKTIFNFFGMSVATVSLYAIFSVLLTEAQIEIPLWIGFLITTIFLIAIKRLNRGKRKLYYTLHIWEMFFLGLFQAVAFIPGVSRFATVLLGSMVLGCNKDSSFYISVISNACISCGSILYLIYKNARNPFLVIISYDTLIAFLITLSLSFIILYSFFHLLRRNYLNFFIIYQLSITILTYFFWYFR